ncbi:hypothetical protein JCM16358_01330 [Halanaerocella petrolearia]
MNRKIAVEGGLSNVTQELQGNGYDIVDLDNQNLQNVDAVVVSGEDNNMMNMSDIKTKAQVINARGMNAFDIQKEIESRLS